MVASKALRINSNKSVFGVAFPTLLRVVGHQNSLSGGKRKLSVVEADQCGQNPG